MKGSHMPCNATSHEIPALYQGHCPFQTSRLMVSLRAACSLAMRSGWDPLTPYPSHPHPHMLRGWFGAKPFGDRSPNALTIPAEGMCDGSLDPLSLPFPSRWHGFGLEPWPCSSVLTALGLVLCTLQHRGQQCAGGVPADVVLCRRR